MNFKTGVGLSVLAVCVLSMLPFVYTVFYELNLVPADAPGLDYLFMWGSPVRVRFFGLSGLLTLAETLLLGIFSLIFLLNGGALKALAFLGALMFAYQGSQLLVGFVRFFLTARKTIDDLLHLFPMLAMTTVGYCVLLVFQRAWVLPLPEGGEPVVATPFQRFYSYAVDMIIFFSLVNYVHLDMLLYEWLVLLVMYVVYFAVFERIFLFTPGKLLLNTRVRMQDGTIPAEAAIIRRTLARLIPLEPLSCFNGQGWKDEISKTTVVKYP